MRRVDGTEFIGHLTSAPAFDDHGELLGLIAVITDQTERIRLDRERQAIELQRETVSMLGVQALRLRSDPGRAATLILTEGIDAVRRLLEADHVTIYEVTAGSNELRVIAGHPAVDEPTAVPSGSRSLAGYVALARKVVVVEDARHDKRFEARPIRPGFRPASAIGAPIFGPNGIAGVLTAESSTLGRFGNSSGPFAQSMATIIGIALLSH
jgi:GAF domain-containing protein